MRFAESGIAGLAAPALNAPLTKVPKALTDLVLASNAGHIGLVFLAGQADNEFASALRLTPRADMALAKAATDAGALLGGGGGGISIPTTSRLIGGYSNAIELRPRQGGIQSLQASNALCLFTPRWWRSDCHSSSPFAWIQHL